MSYIDCGFVPYWNTIYEQFILPSFAVTAREEQFPSKYWSHNPPMLGPVDHEIYHILEDLVRAQEHEPKAPWENPPRLLQDTPLEFDAYKSVKSIVRTNYGHNENFIPLSDNAKESTNTIIHFLDQLISKKSIPISDISDLLVGWSKY